MDLDANKFLGQLDAYLSEFLKVRDSGKQNLPVGHADPLDRDKCSKGS
jgi:hypothetical protein